MKKYTITVFYPLPMGWKQYVKATKAEMRTPGGLVFVDSAGDVFTISHQIPWIVVEEKGQQS
jgi:hypothetical protein